MLSTSSTPAMCIAFPKMNLLLGVWLHSSHCVDDIKFLGTNANSSSEGVLHRSFVDDVFNIRHLYEWWPRRDGVIAYKEKSAFKERCKSELEIQGDVGTVIFFHLVENVFKLVDRPEDSWNRVLKLLTGDVRSERYEVPTGITPFRALQGLSLKTQNKFMDNIISGLWSWSDLKVATNDIKLENKVFKVFTELVEKRYPQDWPLVSIKYRAAVKTLKSEWKGVFESQLKLRKGNVRKIHADMIPENFKAWVQSVVKGEVTHERSETHFKAAYGAVSVEVFNCSVLELVKYIPTSNFALAICDPPFGDLINLDPNPDWNTTGWTQADFYAYAMLLKKIQTTQNFVSFTKVACQQFESCMKGFKNAGYPDIYPVGVYDAGKSDAGGLRYISALQLYCVAHKAGQSQSQWNFPPSPFARHNLMLTRSLTRKSTYTNGDIVNPTESPEGLAAQVIRHHTSPNDVVLVACAGTGADAAAAMKLGRSVIVVERDPRQFDFIVERLSKIGTMITADSAPEIDNGTEINAENFAKQCRAGFTPVYSTPQDFTKGLIAVSTLEQLQDAATLLQQAIEEKKKKVADSLLRGEDEWVEVEPEVSEPHKDESAGVLAPSAAASEFPECVLCGLREKKTNKCKTCAQHVCEGCQKPKDINDVIYCTEVCKPGSE